MYPYIPISPYLYLYTHSYISEYLSVSIPICISVSIDRLCKTSAVLVQTYMGIGF